MSPIEKFIVIMALAAAAGGTLVLLASLANRRAQLMKAYNYQQEMEAHKEHLKLEQSQTETDEIPEAEPAVLTSSEV